LLSLQRWQTSKIVRSGGHRDDRDPLRRPRALFINCTLKRSPEQSHTGGLIDVSRNIMQKHASPST